MRCEESRELVTGFVDEELSTDERTLFEAHLAACSGCADAVSAERRIRAMMRRTGQSVAAPAQLRAVLQHQYGHRQESWWVRVQQWCGMGFRPAPAMALVILILVPLALLMLDSRQAISVETLRIHDAVVAGAIRYAHNDSAEQVAQELSRAVGGKFAPPTYDLRQFGLHTTGGLQQQIDGRDVLVTVYKGTANPITCHSFLGGEGDIPEGAALVYDPVNGKKYFTFSDGALNAVLQQYRDEVCVLVSKMPLDDLVRIARSVQHDNHS